MQKKLIAVAVAGLVSSSAFAQATIYGLLDASVFYNKTQATKNTYGFASNNVASSRLGFKGTEDIGGGLNAFFNLEAEVALASGNLGSTSSGSSGTLDNGFSRAANIGLSGSLGSLTLGRQITPSYWTVATSDVLGMNSGGFTNAWVRSHLANANVVTGVTHTTTNSSGGIILPGSYAAGIGYVSPVVAGLQGRLFVNAGNNTTGADYANNGIKDMSLQYTGFGLTVKAAHQRVESKPATFDLDQITESRDTSYSASYAMGPFKVGAAANRVTYDDTLVNHDTKIVSFGGTYKMNATTLGASYTITKDQEVSENEAKNWTLMVNHDLSKRTAAYAFYTSVKNRGAASLNGLYGGNAVRVAAPAGYDNLNASNSGLAMGLKHSF